MLKIPLFVQYWAFTFYHNCRNFNQKGFLACSIICLPRQISINAIWVSNITPYQVFGHLFDELNENMNGNNEGWGHYSCHSDNSIEHRVVKQVLYIA